MIQLMIWMMTFTQHHYLEEKRDQSGVHGVTFQQVARTAMKYSWLVYFTQI